MINYYYVNGKVLFYFQLALTRVNYEIIGIIGHELPQSKYNIGVADWTLTNCSKLD